MLNIINITIQQISYDFKCEDKLIVNHLKLIKVAAEFCKYIYYKLFLLQVCVKLKLTRPRKHHRFMFLHRDQPVFTFTVFNVPQTGVQINIFVINVYIYI